MHLVKQTQPPRPVTDETLTALARIGRSIAAGHPVNTGQAAVLATWLEAAADEALAARMRQDRAIDALLTTADQHGCRAEMTNVLQLIRKDD